MSGINIMHLIYILHMVPEMDGYYIRRYVYVFHNFM